MKINYFVLAMFLLATEVYIALCVRDGFIRPVFGDFLAVLFLYYLLKAISNKSIWVLSVSSLLVAFTLETLQYFEFLQVMGLTKYRYLKLLIGSAFDWGDVVAYTLGFVFILIIEFVVSPLTKPT